MGEEGYLLVGGGEVRQRVKGWERRACTVGLSLGFRLRHICTETGSVI